MCVGVTFIASSPVFAGLFPPAPWRGSEGSTYQEWHFLTSDYCPPPDFNDNPYGEPLLEVDTPYEWIETIDLAEGVWPLSGEIDMYVPNRPEQLPEKEIWLELIWRPGDMDPGPFLPDEPIVGVTPFESMQMSRTDALDLNGWMHSLFIINMWPNPIEEWITVKGDILVDELMIDTRCIPEPAAICLLGIGGLILLCKRNKEYFSGGSQK